MPRTETPELTIPVGENDHIQGSGDAAVTLVEYGDYECPHCGRAYWIVKKVQEKMGDRLRFVFRNFPLTQTHPHALRAAQAAEIAAVQDKFWEMHDRLYENQNALDDESLIAYAEEIGLDGEKFTEDLRSDAFEKKVRADFMGGVESGVNGTPTFFINGVRFNQSWDYETLLDALERGQHSSQSRASA
jgi:protein-disulfide isomerase